MYDLDEKGTEADVDFESLNSKIASGLYKMLEYSGNFRKEVRIWEEKFSQREPMRMLNGRQIYWMMIQHFKTNESVDGIHDFEMILWTELK